MRRRLCRAVLGTTVALALVCAAARTTAANGARNDHGAEPHLCGFDALHARTAGGRVSGLSRVVAPDGARAVAPADAAWRPIRIAVFTDDVSDSSRHCTEAGQQRPDFEGGSMTCEAGHVLTSAKRRTLLEFLVPSAVKLHEERLMVQPAGGNIVVTSSMRVDQICREFSVPAAHMTTGVADADFVLYMAAGPIAGRTIAWATTCQHFSDGRPSVGVANVSPRYLTAEPQTVRVIAHELLHALGFSIWNFDALKMNSTSSIRGKPSAPVMISPSVVSQEQVQYGCPTQTFMELEDVGGSGTAGSHWKRRSAKDELMVGISGAGYYSALSIAAMEDMGYYKGNYALAEPMSYGQNVSCGLTTGPCVVNGASSIPSMFCSSSSGQLSCTSDRRALGTCVMSEFIWPPAFRYFANPAAGGSDPAMDYCPYVEAFADTNCTVDGGVLPRSVFGVMSRCFDTTNGVSVTSTSFVQYGLCADVRCDAPTKSYSVRVVGASVYTPCPSGTMLSLYSLSPTFSSGSMTCLAYDDVCGQEIDVALYEKYAEVLSGNGVRGVSTCGVAAVTLAALAVLVLAAV